MVISSCPARQGVRLCAIAVVGAKTTPICKFVDAVLFDSLLLPDVSSVSACLV